MLRAAFLVLALAAGAADVPLEIRSKPIRFGEARRRATREYIKARYAQDDDGTDVDPRVIVLHWTATPDLESAWRIFDPELLAGARPELAGAGDLNVSAHFLVDRDGSVYELMPSTWMARHVIGLNLCSIGIENVGGVDGKEDLTPAQVDADARLIAHLKARFPRLEYLIGHNEYRRFERHALWRETDSAYRTEKRDPGPKFLRSVRARVRELGLRGRP